MSSLIAGSIAGGLKREYIRKRNYEEEVMVHEQVCTELLNTLSGTTVKKEV